MQPEVCLAILKFPKTYETDSFIIILSCSIDRNWVMSSLFQLPVSLSRYTTIIFKKKCLYIDMYVPVEYRHQIRNFPLKRWMVATERRALICPTPPTQTESSRKWLFTPRTDPKPRYEIRFDFICSRAWCTRSNLRKTLMVEEMSHSIFFFFEEQYCVLALLPLSGT